jgi:NADH-quinone oxidoreductase subunit N
LNLHLLLPEICLISTAVLIVMLDMFVPNKKWLAAISLTGLAASAGLAIHLWGEGPVSAFFNMLMADKFAIFFKLLFLGVAALVVLASINYLSKIQRFQGEYYALVLFATAGMMLMASVNELISLFVALELVNLSLFALVSLAKDAKSTEASLKYLLLSAFSSAILLFGMALIYGFTGKTQLLEIAQYLRQISVDDLLGKSALLLGVVMMVAGANFKIAAVPFHMWVPDVYEGAPTPITAFLSAGSKAAGFALILRILFSAFMLPARLSMDWGIIFAVLSVLSMTFGNIVAIQQTNFKRMMGYSSVAQVGYILIGLATTAMSQTAGGGQSNVLFFLVSYALTNIVAFTTIIAISNQIQGETINDLCGLGKRSPLLAATLTLAMISLLGIPPAAGFMAKFFIFSTAVRQDLLWLVIIAVINSVISAYYYLRIVKIVWTGTPEIPVKIETSPSLKTGLVLSSLGVLYLGILPEWIFNLATLARLWGV